MSDFTLVIGNKNYSSWSLRPWLPLKVAGVSFTEVKVLLDQPDTAAKIAVHSPSGRVPVLIHGGLRIWDSLAICEYVAESFPAARLWPVTADVRATARSVSAEMHSGFAALRRDLPMNIRERLPRKWGADVQADIDRIVRIWQDCRAAAAAQGPFLFGAFSIADAMFAPVATRFRTYGVPVPPACAAYIEAIVSLPAFLEWEAEALAEPVVERYR